MARSPIKFTVIGRLDPELAAAVLRDVVQEVRILVEIFFKGKRKNSKKRLTLVRKRTILQSQGRQ